MPEDLWAARDGHDTPVARYHELDTVLEEAEALFERLAETEPLVLGTGAPLPAPSPAEAALFGGLGRRAGALRGELARMVDGNRRDDVRWISASPRNVSLRASPIDVAPVLAAAFDAHPGPLVFTSATLSTGAAPARPGAGFAYLRERLGLADTASEAVFPSPFRYHEQALLYLATDLPDPTLEAFPPAAARRMLELCAGLARAGAAAVHQLPQPAPVRGAVPARADGFPLLVQGERPRHVLLESLRTNIGSVLLATQGFWEGVDVPGEALSLVAMDRLPFAVPADPLTAARIDHIREGGGDPFASYQLPAAALALKQGFGRLIRSRRDRGVVAILDGRIARRNYGHTLLESLPRSCPRTEDLDEVARFFA